MDANGWTHVSKELPEPYIYVLVYYKYGGMSIAYTIDYSDGRREFSSMFPVEFWQHLPKCPTKAKRVKKGYNQVPLIEKRKRL